MTCGADRCSVAVVAVDGKCLCLRYRIQGMREATQLQMVYLWTCKQHTESVFMCGQP